MANFARGLASGFDTGIKIGEALRRKQMRDEFEAAQQEKEFQKYTPAQALQMQQEAAMVDEQGRPMYRFTIEPGSTSYQRQQITYPEMQARGEYTPDFSGYGLGTPESIMYRTPPGGAMEGPIDLTGVANYAPARGLSVSEGNYTPTLLPSQRPEESDLYRQLMTRYGESTTMAPKATEYLGKTYEGGLTPQARDAALMSRYADIISREDPIEGMKLRTMAAQEARAAEESPLRLQNLRQQIATGQIDLETKGFALQDLKATRSLTDFMAANPNASTKDIFAKADELKMSPKARGEIIQQLTGVSQGELDLAKTQITKQISGLDRKQLLQAHKDNPNITPGAHYEEAVDKKGNISLYLVDTNTGQRLTDKPDFVGSAAEVDKYLRTAATAPETLLDYTMNLKKTQADILSKQAGAAKDFAAAQYYGAGGGLGKSSFEVAGFDKDNTPILFDRQTGYFGRRDGKPIQDADFTKKFRGAEATSVTRQEEIAYGKMLESDEWQRARTAADQAKVMRKFNLDPEKFRMAPIPGGGW
jgi:hypothetical protein